MILVDFDPLHFIITPYILVEDKVNMGIVLCHATVQDLFLVSKIVNRLVPESRTANFLWCNYSRPILPYIIFFLQRSLRLVCTVSVFHHIGAHIQDDLFRYFYRAPCSKIEISSIKVVGKHEYMLVTLRFLLDEVETELSDAGVYAVHPAPSPMIIEL